MHKFLVTWQMSNADISYDEKNCRYFWKNELNANWILKCVSRDNKTRNPSFVEVHRKSFVGKYLVSGTLELQDQSKPECLAKKRFVCLLEDGCSFLRIELQHSCHFLKTKTFSLSGELKVSANRESAADLAKIFQLENTDDLFLIKLAEDLKRLCLKESLLADVSLKCGSVTIPAHKIILSARSPVFEAMFRSKMKETIDNEVVIEDVEAPILQLMLRFIYTGKTEDLTVPLASHLLYAASKYQIENLESACREYLISKMSMRNAVGIFLVGDLLSPSIKKFAMDFICNNCTDFSALERTEDWLAIKSNKPALALEILSCVAKFQERKLNLR